MLERYRKAREEDEGGFTLIELLIVIVILGVLASIVVFAVGGITDRGKNAACSSDLKTIQVAEEANYAQLGSYDTLANLKAHGFIHSTPDTYTVGLVAGPPASYTLTGVKGAANDCTGTNG